MLSSWMSNSLFNGGIALTILFVSGCGVGEYNAGIEATAKQFTYFNNLDNNLQPSFVDRGIGIRVPKAFQLAYKAPPPPKPKGDGEDGDSAPPPATDDPQQPYPAAEALNGVRFPGTVAAWQTEISGGETPQQVWLFLLSNHDLWLSEETRDVANSFFPLLVEGTLTRLRGVPVNLAVNGKWRTVDFPMGESYVPKRPYSAGVIAALDASEQELRLEIFLHQVGDHQVAVILVLPKDAKLAGTPAQIDPIALMLGSLDVTPTRPLLPGEQQQTNPTGF